MINKIIDINEYRNIKTKREEYNKDRVISLMFEEEERKKTLNLFIKVLETMEKESYKWEFGRMKRTTFAKLHIE